MRQTNNKFNQKMHRVLYVKLDGFGGDYRNTMAIAIYNSATIVSAFEAIRFTLMANPYLPSPTGVFQ